MVAQLARREEADKTISVISAHLTPLLKTYCLVSDRDPRVPTSPAFPRTRTPPQWDRTPQSPHASQSAPSAEAHTRIVYCIFGLFAHSPFRRVPTSPHRCVGASPTKKKNVLEYCMQKGGGDQGATQIQGPQGTAGAARSTQGHARGGGRGARGRGGGDGWGDALERLFQHSRLFRSWTDYLLRCLMRTSRHIACLTP